MLTSYGRSTIRKSIALSLAGGAIALLLPPLAGIPLAALALLFLLFTLYFFRDPQRTAPEDANAILAPADGKVLLIETRDHPFTGPSSTLISIFMSPLDVHVNRIPLSGTVSLLNYRPGSFGMAFDHRSMEQNERQEIGITSGPLKLHFSQISGFLARRIVCPLEEGMAVEAGHRFGMIKFGSRVDIHLPAGILPLVKPGERTRAGETVLARK